MRRDYALETNDLWPHRPKAPATSDFRGKAFGVQPFSLVLPRFGGMQAILKVQTSAGTLKKQ